MLSVNIPVYNFDVVKLVRQIVCQANSLAISYEVRVYDDKSDEVFQSINRSIKVIPNVIYIELEENLGRAAIRNKMGLESEYENLLFIDADSALVNENYLKTYVEHLKPSTVICGGTAYSSQKPKDNKLLRWIYGQKREAISAKKRNKSKSFIITSNNFLVEKRVFEQICFREGIKKYGHEDTLLGYDLWQNGIDILHIQNPVEHTGLESSHLFIQKTKMALKNLDLITKTLLEGDTNFKKQMYFLRAYSILTKCLPPAFFQWYFSRFSELMEKNLKGKRPNLRCFDFYKLGYYATLQKPLT